MTLLSPIYLDYAATTPVDPQVAEQMLNCLTDTRYYGNATSNHVLGRQAAQLIAQARQQVAELIHADADEIIWTSGATEANNLAIKGVAYAYQAQGKHIITSQTEHSSVLKACHQLEQQGFRVSYLKPQTNGLLTLEQIQEAICPDTVLLSIMQVNNELGVIQDIAAIAELAQRAGIIFHVDAVQAAGRLPIDVQKLPVALMSFSAHKLYGPKGVGALYLRRHPRVKLQPLILGGSQEYGLRSGTLATHQIVGMGTAFALAKQRLESDQAQIAELAQRFWQGLQAIGGVYRHGDTQACVPHILNISFEGISAVTLLLALKDLAVSTGSACHGLNAEPSHVLQAISCPKDLAQGAVRFSLGRLTTSAEIDYVISRLQRVVKDFRELLLTTC